jgi:hypothetical protein
MQSHTVIDQGVALAQVCFCSDRANINENQKEFPDLWDPIIQLRE